MIVRELGAVAGVAAAVGLVALTAVHLSLARDIRRLGAWARRESVRPRPGPGARRVAVAVAGLLALGGAAAVIVAARGGEEPSAPKARRAPVRPGTVTVAVLNGTTVPGLAAALRDEIAAAGFKKGPIDVFSDQGLTESVIQYAPGRQAAAKAVGRRVGISEREPATADSRTLAGDATVIVIAGADKAP